MSEDGCPHENVQYCPLYLALHDPALMKFGCADDKLDHGGCGADRRIDYTKQLERLTNANVEFVREALLREMCASINRRKARAALAADKPEVEG